eukprot:6647230-Pyramimonas_sp.AAC.1
MSSSASSMRIRLRYSNDSMRTDAWRCCASWRSRSDSISTPCRCSPIRRTFRFDSISRFDAD